MQLTGADNRRTTDTHRGADRRTGRTKDGKQQMDRVDRVRHKGGVDEWESRQEGRAREGVGRGKE